MLRIFAYTDGACSGNPGPGGWAAILMAKSADKIIQRKEIFGGEIDTTNNRMELTAVIKALSALNKKTTITIVSDSKYVINGITKWLNGWKKNDWKNASNKPVKNVDLWQKLDELIRTHSVTFEWVKGHDNNEENERADFLARSGISNVNKS